MNASAVNHISPRSTPGVPQYLHNKLLSSSFFEFKKILKYVPSCFLFELSSTRNVTEERKGQPRSVSCFKTSSPGDEKGADVVAQGEGPNNMASVNSILDHFRSVTISSSGGSRYNQNCCIVHTVNLSSS